MNYVIFKIFLIIFSFNNFGDQLLFSDEILFQKSNLYQLKKGMVIE